MNPHFYYDLNSPYAYLAAMRIEELLPTATWQPVAFAFMLRALGRRPWSFDQQTRADGQAEVQRRAAERGLPPVHWPPGWPVESYSLMPLRAVIVAAEQGLERDLTRGLFRRAFADGAALSDVEGVLDVAAAVGVDRDAVREGVGRQSVKDALRRATDEALARGAIGVPTVAVGEELFWGDDRLPEAAARAAMAVTCAGETDE